MWLRRHSVRLRNLRTRILTGKRCRYLYQDGDLYNFMDVETYDQIALNSDVVGDALKFVKENETVKICSHKGNVFSVEPPLFVELAITETEPGLQGRYSSGSYKTGNC